MKYVYKIGCVLLAAIVIGVVFFAPIIGIRLHSEMATLFFANAVQNGDEEMIQQYIDADGEIPEHISDTTSLYDIAFGDTGEFFKGFSNLFDIMNNPEIEVIFAPAMVFVVSIVVTVLCALAVIIFGIFAKNNRKVIYASVAGIGSFFLLKESFELIEDIFVSGRLTIASLTQEWWASLFGEIVNFELLETLNAIPIVFVIVIVWTVLYNYTLTPAQKKERMRMLGEVVKD